MLKEVWPSIKHAGWLAGCSSTSTEAMGTYIFLIEVSAIDEESFFEPP